MGPDDERTLRGRGQPPAPSLPAALHPRRSNGDGRGGDADGAPRRSDAVDAEPAGRAGWADTRFDPGDVEVVLLDRDGVIVAANRSWLEFCRANGGDPALVGAGASYLAACDVVADEDPAAAQVASAVRAAVRGDLPAPLRIRIPCHAPDAERWFDVLVSSRHDDLGVCVGSTLTLSPAPPPRAGTPAHWRAFDLVPDPVYVFDVTGRVEYTNPAGSTLLGYPDAELVGRMLAELDPGTDLLAAGEDLAILRLPGATLVRACDLRRKDGSRVPVEALVRSTVDDAERPRFVVVARDLRPRHAAEALLRAGEESFRAAFDLAPIGMAVIRLDDEGHRTLLRVNTALADFLGEPVEGLIGRDLQEFTASENLEHDRQVVEGLRTGRRMSYARHKRWRRADGSFAWAEVRVSRVDLPGIEGPTTLAHFVDVTESHQTEQLRARHSAANAAVAEITTSVLAETSLPEVYQRIAEAIARAFDAQSVNVVLPDPETGEYYPAAAVGPVGQLFLSGRVPIRQSFVRRVVDLGALAIPTLEATDKGPEFVDLVGPAAAARFGPVGPGGGLLVAFRARGADPFTEAEVALLVALSQQVALAVELGRARADQQRLAVLEDRQRIARDLHDTVIQDLIAIGMQVDARLSREPDPARQQRGEAIVDQLEMAVRRLRGSVFDLRDPLRGRLPSDAIRSIATEAARVLGHTPFVRVEGPADAVPMPVADALVAVLRESLSNVARHARATATTITLEADADHVVLSVEDDGQGLPRSLVGGDGLANIRERAAKLGGAASIAPATDGGTRLVWTCPT